MVTAVSGSAAVSSGETVSSLSGEFCIGLLISSVSAEEVSASMPQSVAISSLGKSTGSAGIFSAGNSSVVV